MESRPIAEGPAIRVFFLGSGSLGVPVLDALHQSADIHILGVASQPDRPSGRSKTPTPTPLADHAETLGLDVSKPESVNSPEFLDTLAELNPDIVVVVAFGQFLKARLLSLAPFGCFNVHASLLPRHRGASPVAAAILAGDAETGISFMHLDAGMDTGPVYSEEKMLIPPNATTFTLEMDLSELAAKTVVDTLVDVVRNGLEPQPQDDARATHAPKIKKNDGIIDWTRPAEFIERTVRAYQPWPKATCFIPRRKGLRRLQIIRCQVVPLINDTPPASNNAPGTILATDDDRLTVACGENALAIERLTPEGSREMTAAEFLRGTQLEPGAQLLGRTSQQVQNQLKGL